MATGFKDAPEVRRIAEQLAEEHHDLLGHLCIEEIRFRFRDKAQRKNGKVVLGTAELKSGIDALEIAGEFNGYKPRDPDEPEFKVPASAAFFRIVIAHDTWKDLTGPQRKALVFHELLHCGEDDDMQPMIVPHDVEEFRAVVSRFGLWKGDLEWFASACVDAAKQQTLPLYAEPNRTAPEPLPSTPPAGPSKDRRVAAALKRNGTTATVEFDGEQGDLNSETGEVVIRDFVEREILAIGKEAGWSRSA